MEYDDEKRLKNFHFEIHARRNFYVEWDELNIVIVWKFVHYQCALCRRSCKQKRKKTIELKIDKKKRESNDCIIVENIEVEVPHGGGGGGVRNVHR